MKRRLLKVFLFLLLGAIINVAVAWSCAIWIVPKHFTDILFLGLGDDRICGGYIGSGLGVRSIHWAQNHSRQDMGTSLSNYTLMSPPYWSRFHNDVGPLIGDIDGYLEEGRGWPMISLSYGISFAHNATTYPHAGNLRTVTDGISLGDWPVGMIRYGPVPKALPVRPVAIGFGTNTVFYATILWLLFAAPFALRRRLRSKRGLCPACAYPIGASDVCTECGTPVRKQTIETQKADLT